MPLSSRLLTLPLHSRSIPLPYGVGGQPYGVTVADFNGDGKLDLAIACPDPEIPPPAQAQRFLFSWETGMGPFKLTLTIRRATALWRRWRANSTVTENR